MERLSEIKTFSITEEGNNWYDALILNDNHIGCVNFSHEYDIAFHVDENKKIDNISVWEMNCSAEWTWDKDDYEDSEKKALIDNLQAFIYENKLS